MEHESSLQKTKKSLVSCGSGLTRSCRPDPTLNPGAVERVSNAPLCSATAAQAGGTIIHQLILHTQIIITSAIQCLLKDIYKKKKKTLLRNNGEVVAALARSCPFLGVSMLQFLYFPKLVHVRLEKKYLRSNDYNLTSFHNQRRKEIISTPRPLSIVTLCIHICFL